MDIADRFWAKTEADPNGGCILWAGAMYRIGYGSVKWRRGTARAHRVAWELRHGPIPPGVHICHKCDVRACVNVDHLYAGDHAVNMRDKALKGRAHRLVGEANGRCRITEAEAVALLRRQRTGERISHVAEARRLGVKDVAVYRLLTGRSWAHLHSQVQAGNGDGN
jgi:hypothetical protein